MSNKHTNMNSFNIKLVSIFAAAFLIGILAALSFRFIKYTEFIDPKINEIDPKVAYNNILDSKNKIILIDVRSKAEYDLAHASSSVNLPIHYLYDDTHGIKNEKGIPLPQNTDTEIYLLCTGGRLAGVAYSYLEHYGYRNITRVEGGLSNWNAEGLPIIAKSIFDIKNINSGESALDRPYVIQK